MSQPDDLQTLQLVAGLLGHERTAWLARMFPYPRVVPGAPVWQDVVLGIYSAHGGDFGKIYNAIHHKPASKNGKAKIAKTKTDKAKIAKTKTGKAKTSPRRRTKAKQVAKKTSGRLARGVSPPPV